MPLHFPCVGSTRSRSDAPTSRESLAFYRETLGAHHVVTFDPPGLAFFQLGDTRLLLERSASPHAGDATLYFEVEDLGAAHEALVARGVVFDSEPHLIHRDADGTFGAAGTEEWMAFFRDPDGNSLALVSRVAQAEAGA